MAGPFLVFRGPVEGASLPADLRRVYDYLEHCMDFRTPGLLWSHFVQARAVPRDGGVERSVRFPRVMHVGQGVDWLPPGDYLGEMTLHLSNPACYPSYQGGTLSPSIASDAARRPDCTASLVLERLSPLAASPAPPPPPDLDGTDLLLY